MKDKKPVYVRYVELTPLAEQIMDDLECEVRLEVPGLPAGNFYCIWHKLIIPISACAVCLKLMQLMKDALDYPEESERVYTPEADRMKPTAENKSRCMGCGLEIDDREGLYRGFGCPECHSPFVVKISKSEDVESEDE